MQNRAPRAILTLVLALFLAASALLPAPPAVSAARLSDSKPTLPSSVAVFPEGVGDGIWTNQCGSASFSWSGAVGTDGKQPAGYYVYWGADPDGTSSDYQNMVSYFGNIGSGETKYLRVQVKDVPGIVSDWGTIFTYRCDTEAPDAPTDFSLSPTQPSVWSNRNPSVSWAAPSDPGESGIQGYAVVWNHALIMPKFLMPLSVTTTEPVSTPGPLTSGNDWYIHILALDNAYNWADTVATAGPFWIDATNPSAPSGAAEAHAVTDNHWQREVNQPSFSWNPASDGTGSGVDGYELYWGADPAGATPSTFTSLTQFAAPDPVSSPSVTYLRGQTHDLVGNSSGWVTLFTYRYDAEAPSGPTTVSEGGGAADRTWNSRQQLDFNWSGANDGSGSGVSGYYVYWGTDPAGASGEWSAQAAYTPPASPASGTYYLRVQTRDTAGNSSAWQTLFTQQFDATPPTAAVDALQSVQRGFSFTVSWGGADAQPGSGLQSYDVQYRIGSSGAWTDWLTQTSSTNAVFGPNLPCPLVHDQVYYFRVRARDSAGNVSAYSASGDTATTAAWYQFYLPISLG